MWGCSGEYHWVVVMCAAVVVAGGRLSCEVLEVNMGGAGGKKGK